MRTLFIYIYFFFINMFYFSYANAVTDTVVLRKGMIITHSVVVRKGCYKIDASQSLENGVIEIRGNNIVVDFNGAVLQGSNDVTRPDKFFGLAVHILGGKNIIIKNAVVHGYKIGFLATNVLNIRIKNCDFSYNFRQHLNSNRQREDLSDWQSYHHNEKEEWMRFGAGMYIKNCDSLLISNNIITGGQCGLMMVLCKDGLIINNNFSFNSGIGIGFYRSSYNKVFNNIVDWNVRGVSDGVYYRGQDAAAILVYEQSSHNMFAYNSATHSGDGFFLWAGESTLETGQGGCNDNLIYGNDFSYAPTNGVETTFSSNRIINNKIFGCDYGVWAGYSHNTQIMGNSLENNQTGIAIEQGQDNRIMKNTFIGEHTGIQLWAIPGRPNQMHYDDHRDVRSRNYTLRDNLFSKVATAFSIRHSESIDITHNHLKNTKELIHLDSGSKKVLIRDNDTADISSQMDRSVLKFAPKKIPGSQNIIGQWSEYDGKQYIMLTEWGPYDFRSPILWKEDINEENNGVLKFDIFGPRGKWKVEKLKGVDSLSSLNGSVPGKITVYTKKHQTIDIQLTYIGQTVVSPFGKEYAAGNEYSFGFEKMYLPVKWNAKLFSFDSTNDPLKHPSAFEKMLKDSVPIKQIETTDLNNRLWNASGGTLPQTKIATEAVGEVDFPKGDYVLGVSAGEMVKVFIDGRLIIDAWDPSKVIYDADYHHEKELSLHGHHDIRVVQAQYGSYGMLFLTLLPKNKSNY